MSDELALNGLKVLVVDDVYVIAMDLCDQLSDAGCEVIGPAATVELARRKIEGVALDGAVLDINLGGESSFPLAEALVERGVPFLFLTGYDSPTAVPRKFADAPRLLKPVNSKALISAVELFRR